MLVHRRAKSKQSVKLPQTRDPAWNISEVRFDKVNVSEHSVEWSVDMTLSRATLIKNKHSQNGSFKSNVALKKRMRNVGLCNMSLEIWRNTAYVYKPIMANTTMSTRGFSSLVRWVASGREASWTAPRVMKPVDRNRQVCMKMISG